MKKAVNIKGLVRPHIIGMKPYSSARLEYEGNDGVFLDANENPYGSVCGDHHNRYPDPLQHTVKEKLALMEDLDMGQIFLGNGSDECIDLLIRAFCEPGKDKILVCPPVFSMYEHAAQSQHTEIISVLLKEETFQLDVEAIQKAIVPDLKIIFLCSPNNPTGNLLQEEDILEVLNTFGGLVLIDEAYQDFSDQESWTKKLNEYRNLVVIKTFSKSYGMADARLGMLYADAEIIHYLNTIKLPYNVNAHTQQLACVALERTEQKMAYVQELVQGRKYLETEMKGISCVQQVFPSDANYLLFRVAGADALYAYLLTHKVIVRNRNKMPLCAGCLRVSVGTREENEKFIQALKNYNP